MITVMLACLSFSAGIAFGLWLTRTDNQRLRDIAIFQEQRAESWMNAAIKLGENAVDHAHEVFHRLRVQ